MFVIFLFQTFVHFAFPRPLPRNISTSLLHAHVLWPFLLLSIYPFPIPRPLPLHPSISLSHTSFPVLVGLLLCSYPPFPLLFGLIDAIPRPPSLNPPPLYP